MTSFWYSVFFSPTELQLQENCTKDVECGSTKCYNGVCSKWVYMVLLYSFSDVLMKYYLGGKGHITFGIEGSSKEQSTGLFQANSCGFEWKVKRLSKKDI